MTTSAAQARLETLGRSPDKAVAAPALEALAAVQDAQDDAGAEASWRRALALDPARPEALRGLAAHLASAGRLDELRVLLAGSLPPTPGAPDSVPVRLMLAATLLALDLPDVAETQTRLALQSAPDNPAAGLLLAGLVLRSGGAPEAATSETLAEAARRLATVQAGIGPPMEGEQSAEEQQQADLQTMQAVLLALTGDPTVARLRLLGIVRTHPFCTQAREALAAMTPMSTVAP